jgi:Colicin V production protein
MTGNRMSSSSASWLLPFFAAAGLFVLWKAWRGWRLGVVRQVAGLVALGAAWLCGVFGGALMAPILRAVWPGPDRVLAAAGGILLGLFAFLVITLTSALVFKKTEHQSVGLVRLGYGAAGAVVGAGYGIILVWMAVLVVRLLGTVAETQLAVEKNPRFHTKPTAKQAAPGAMLGGLAQLKHSLEEGAVGAVVQQVDPIPGHVYSTLGKMGRMASSPASMERFIRYPGVEPLLHEPKLAALLSDPQVSRAVTQRNYLALLSNPHLLAAANDPALAAALGKVDLEKALDFALAGGKKVNGDP